jgi:hypothetical protein
MAASDIAEVGTEKLSMAIDQGIRRRTGNPAVMGPGAFRPEALRPRLSTGLPLQLLPLYVKLPDAGKQILGFCDVAHAEHARRRPISLCRASSRPLPP